MEEKNEKIPRNIIPYNTVYKNRTIAISIAGLIGTGKTTLTKRLSDYLGYEPFFEPVEKNPYLDLFYSNMKMYSFHLQVYFLAKRFKIHQQMLWNTKNVVQDRSIYEDLIFAKMLREQNNMTETDFQTYVDLSSDMLSFLRPMDLIIYLDVKPETAFERIKERARNCESGLPIEYLRDLEKAYKEWLQSDIPYTTKKMILNWEEFLPIEQVVEKINTFLRENGSHLQLTKKQN